MPTLIPAFDGIQTCTYELLTAKLPIVHTSTVSYNLYHVLHNCNSVVVVVSMYVLMYIVSGYNFH